MNNIETEIICVCDTHENDIEWIFVRRLDNYEIIIMIKDGCGNYTPQGRPYESWEECNKFVYGIEPPNSDINFQCFEKDILITLLKTQ